MVRASNYNNEEIFRFSREVKFNRRPVQIELSERAEFFKALAWRRAIRLRIQGIRCWIPSKPVSEESLRKDGFKMQSAREQYLELYYWIRGS